MTRFVTGKARQYARNIALLLVFGTSCWAQKEIGGTVHDSKGPASEVLITLRGGSGGSRLTQTGADGKYRFSGLGTGNYELIFERPGFQTLTHAVELTYDETDEIEVMLSPASKGWWGWVKRLWGR